jgi:hypothetical protein
VKKKRNKPYRPRPTRTPLIVGAALVFNPLEAILDQLEAHGTLDCSARGTPMFRDLTDGNWYDTAAALAGVIDHLEMYEIRHGVSLPIESLRRFHRFITHDMPIPSALMGQLRRALPTVQRSIALSDPEDVADLYRQCLIKYEIEKSAPCP